MQIVLKRTTYNLPNTIHICKYLIYQRLVVFSSSMAKPLLLITVIITINRVFYYRRRLLCFSFMFVSRSLYTLVIILTSQIIECIVLYLPN